VPCLKQIVAGLPLRRTSSIPDQLMWDLWWKE